MNTEIVKILSLEDGGEIALKRAAEIIKDGGLVVFPTETVYGIGGDATNPKAAKKIYAAKGRPSDNPLIIHISTPEEAEKYAYTSGLYYKLAERFMPGPITLILKAKDSIPPETRGGLETVAVRCPEHKVARELIRLAGVPIAAPSANISGSPSPTSAKHVIDDMNGRVDMIIDGGEAEFGLESTILKIDENDTITLLRPGRITQKDIEACIGKIEISGAVTAALAEGERVLSPGMKYRHYAPKCPVVLIDGAPSAAVRFIKEDAEDKRVAVVAYTEDTELFSDELNAAEIIDFGARSDELTQAHRLFSLLREADKKSFDKIYAPLPSKEGIGLALYNRMIRAAAYNIVKLN